MSRCTGHLTEVCPTRAATTVGGMGGEGVQGILTIIMNIVYGAIRSSVWCKIINASYISYYGLAGNKVDSVE